MMSPFFPGEYSKYTTARDLTDRSPAMLVLFATSVARFQAALDLQRRAGAIGVSVVGLISIDDGMLSKIMNEETAECRSSLFTDAVYVQSLINDESGTYATAPPLTRRYG